MLTPKDLENLLSKSGFTHVLVTPDPSRKKPYQAQSGGGHKGKPELRWYGPRRATALEAAQDYCDYMNGTGVTHAKPLKSAGHKRKRRSRANGPEVQSAYSVIRDAKAAKEGDQGFVYLIAETDNDGAVDMLWGYGKIGFALDPEERIIALQTGNPRKLRLVSYFPGTKDDERAAQQKWHSHNVLQEWFRLGPLLWYDLTHRKGVVLP